MSLAIENAKRWANMRIPAQHGPTFEAVANRLSAPAAKKRYQDVSAKTGVPWQFIAVTHEREASQNWNTQLGQGDPLHKKSVHVPKGRGPFDTWEEGAIDALVNCPPYAARNKDWSIGGTLAMLEKYNGLGYAGMGRPSPYIWSHTNQYTSGKYVADHVYDPSAVDSQLGCAGILKFMGWGKDHVSGPVTAIPVVGGLWLSLTHFLSGHPYLAGVIAIGGGLAIYAIVHAYKNRKTCLNGLTTTSPAPHTDGGSTTSGGPLGQDS